MNSGKTSTSCTNFHTNTNKIHKKNKRKRRKNKFKNSNLNVKRHILKKFDIMNFTSDGKSKPVKHSMNNSRNEHHFKNLSSNWYWSNYKKALDWQERHKAAQWKNHALALQEENKYLLKIIDRYLPDMFPQVPITRGNLYNIGIKKSESYANNPMNVKHSKNENGKNSDFYNYNDGYIDGYNDITYHGGYDDDDDDVDDDMKNEEENELEFEMSEEMIKFFEDSFKHKMNLKKEKEEKSEQLKIEKKIVELHQNRSRRSLEMKLLYGDDASKIIGMETAVQLSYERYCDMKSPNAWPNIPLRL